MDLNDPKKPLAEEVVPVSGTPNAENKSHKFT